ncbi:MAG: S1 family peptidase [Bacteroidota bacterium]
MRSWLLLGLASLFLIQCNYNPYRGTDVNERRYLSAFPQRNTSKALQDAFGPIKKINSIAYYDFFTIDPELRLTRKEINQYPLEQIKANKTFVTQSSAGTATIISTNYRSLALLTCDHVVSKPDTTYQYHLDETGKQTKYVKSVSVKTNQQNLIYGFPELGSFKIIANDPSKDIALLSVNIDSFENLELDIFNLPTGQPEKLEWGTFVYILGYPKGFKMVTRGIVSNPNDVTRGSYMLDALFNPGISGGMILALRGTDQHFEWVGMARSTQITTKKVLTPDPQNLNDLQLYTPYSGTPYVDNINSINYGVTRPISVTDIKNFLLDIETELRDAGFTLNHILK